MALCLPFQEYFIQYRTPEGLRLTDNPFRELSGFVKISFIYLLYRDLPIGVPVSV